MKLAMSVETQKAAAFGALCGGLGTVALRFLLKAIDGPAATTPKMFPTLTEVFWLLIVWPANTLITLIIGNVSRDGFEWRTTALAALINAVILAGAATVIVRRAKRRRTKGSLV